MFGAFKIPGTGNNASGSTNVNNSPGTGNSIFGAMGFAVPIMTAAPTTNTAQQTTDKTTTESDDLPPGWRLVNSRQSGREYYVHIASGHTQWDKPTESEPKKTTNVATAFSTGVTGMRAGFTSMLTQANKSLQTTLQQRVGIASTNVTTKYRDSGNRDGQCLVEIFENDRLDGRLLPHDPKKFSEREAVVGKGYDDLPEGNLPEGHEWTTDWEVDINYTAVDRDGWTYAVDFNDAVRLLNEDLSHASRHPSDMVRRRRWVRYSHEAGSELPQPPHSPTQTVDSANKSLLSTNSWGLDSIFDKGGVTASESGGGLFGEIEQDDDPFSRTAQKGQSGFRVNMKFPHRGGKDNTKDYQSINLVDVKWLVNANDVTATPTDEMMREKTANLEERIKVATQRSVSMEKDLRLEHEKKTRDIAVQQKKLDALITEYRKLQRENEMLQDQVVEHRKTVEEYRKKATEKDLQLNEEQRALNAEMAAANQALEEKAKALATARMRYKRDNKSLAAAVEDAKKRLEQQKAKAEMDAQDPLSKVLKSEMDKVRQLHEKLEAVRQHRLVIEEESKALFNVVVEKKADLKFKSKKKLESALKDVDDKLRSLKEEQATLTKQLTEKPGDDLRQLNARRNEIRSEMGALKERRMILLIEKRKQERSD